ncbi:MAG TPA: hypothetical protein VFW22_00310 [Pseudolabrys sp.]|nr:hypothetical protein [Pseudolabrys sp.]
MQYSTDEEKVFEATKHIGPAIIWFAIGGLLAVLAWAIGLGVENGGFSWAKFFQTIGLFVLIAGAAGAVGGLLGFLFGVPRTREAAAAIQQGTTAEARRAVLAANTNLERVSDWLTTLLLGATLVQIKPLIEWVGGLGANLQDHTVETLMPIVVVYFLVVGFLGVYLMTRLYLTYSLQLMLNLGLEAAPPLALDATTSALTEALSSGDTGKLRAALATFDQQKSQPDVAASPAANGLAARATAVLVKAPGVAAGEKTALLAAIPDLLGKATADATVKQSLQADPVRKELQDLDAATQAKVDALLK